MANWELMRLIWNSLTYSVLLECDRQTIDSRKVQFAVQILKTDYPSKRIIHLGRIIRLDVKTGRCSVQTDNSSDFIRLFIRLFKRILRTNYSSRVHTRQINSTYFSIQTRLQCVLAFQKKKNEGEVVFYLKSLELERVRTIVGFVEQNMASKVKALTRQNKQKSQGKGKTFKKNTWSKREPSFFLQYYPHYTEETSLGLGSSFRKFALKKKWCIRVFFSST